MSSSLFDTLRGVLLIIVLAISFFIVLTYLLSMGLGILVFFSTIEGLNFSRGVIPIHPLLVIDMEVTVNAGLYFLFLWCVFALCFAAAWKYRESLPSKAREFFSSPTKWGFFKNNLLAMPVITSMLLVAIIALHYFQSQSGVPTGSLPQSDPFLDFLKVSRAPLVEEIIFRIIPIGSFLVIYLYIVGKRTKPYFSWSQRLKTVILSVLQPEKAKEKIGLRTINERGLFRGMTWGEWIMVGFTAFLFGIAHYFGGWGPGKISQAAMSGAVFALAYLYYGIQAPILLHWYFNYYFTVFDLSLNYYSEINLQSFAFTANFLFGAFLWLVILISLSVAAVSTILRALTRKPEAIPVPKPPPF